MIGANQKKCLTTVISVPKDSVPKTCTEKFFLNDTELSRLPQYQIRQTIAQSKCLDEYTSGKTQEKFSKNFPPTQFLKKLKIDHFG